MRSIVMIIGMTLVASQALAADLNSSQVGSACGGGEAGAWHFVNNQTRGADAPGLLTACFDDVGFCIDAVAYQVSRNNQHFEIVGPSGPLTEASTNLAGKLVLSDLDCTPVKPPPCDDKDPKCKPPPCDPKDTTCK